MARPQAGYDFPTPASTYGAPEASNRVASFEPVPQVAILRDDRTNDNEGSYNVEFEAENGISFRQSGSPDGEDGAVVKSGSYS